MEQKQGIHETGDSSVETVVQGNTEFAIALYQKLRTMEGNLFFSPYSISTALAMTYAGARGNTEIQIGQALHFLLEQKQLHPAFALLKAKLDEVEKKGYIQLRVANALWPQKGYTFLEEFLALIKQFYGVLITAVDYNDAEVVRHTINRWVEEKTENKIKKMIPSGGMLNELTRLVLVNAIYFKGGWVEQFPKKFTDKTLFHVSLNKRIHVAMMNQECCLMYGESDSLQILELPYNKNDLSMLLLLPKEIEGLVKLEKSLTVENLDRWTRNLKWTNVKVFLPKFKISFQFSLGDTLKSMGMIDAFLEKSADFSGMNKDVNKAPLFISAVLHKTFITVNEEVTEAAATTTIEIELLEASFPPPTTTIFCADHPFVFLIRENSTGSILFLGRIVEPNEKALLSMEEPILSKLVQKLAAYWKKKRNYLPYPCQLLFI